MENGKSHVVYILECSDKTYYTGYTNDLDKRIAKHQSGKGAKYTRGRSPLKLMFTKGFATKEEAMKEEYRIKRLSRKEKEKLFDKGED
ncbi:GIY-YIG nuclease family protein [Bacillus marinisedimentorum]|uniref:GIY-YIG nuclease family protein n=1 Tax=Bacillus marinisedimentorum TaxID=1821260 RepID=UPI000871EFEA|nr:GIY-YIG nuclease family protein [Bacillus marinisedimentorum]